MGKNNSPRRSLAPLVLGLCIWLLWPAQALARALVRFVHGVPGVGAATVDIGSGSGSTQLGTISFAESTQWRNVRSGSFPWHLVGSDGKTLAHGTATVGNGAYTIVVEALTKGVGLGIYRDRAGEPGTSLIRVIHAAPELGSPELELDSHVVVKSLGFTQATPYLSVKPGVHSLSAMRPGDAAALVSVPKVTLTSGVAYSAIVLGSRGQRVRVVTVTDRGAPLTRPAPAHATPKANPAPTGGWITVHSGDSLWKIASAQLGDQPSNSAIEREVVAIWDANAGRIGTGDPNLIFPGQRLHIP